MGKPRQTPIIIGVADIVNRSKKVEDAREPLQLIVEAIQAALQDSTSDASAAQKLQNEIDSIDVVQTWTWPYSDLPGLIAERLAVRPRRKHQSDHGGNQPALLVDEAARRIAKGQTKVAVVTGGEALASCNCTILPLDQISSDFVQPVSACAAAGKLPPPNWTQVKQDVTSVFSPTKRELQTGIISVRLIHSSG